MNQNNKKNVWIRLFCLQLEASCLQLSFFAYSCALDLTIRAFSTCNTAFLRTIEALFTYSWSFLLTVGKRV